MASAKTVICRTRASLAGSSFGSKAVGEPPLMLQALERGVVDAPSLSVPASFMAKSKGFFELVNYDNLGLAYPMHSVTTLRSTIGKNPQLVERVLKTLIEAVAVFKNNKENPRKP